MPLLDGRDNDTMQANTITFANKYTVIKMPSAEGKKFIRKNHYSKSCHNGPMCWGLYCKDELVGVCAFATPCSENVRASVFGPERKNAVTELHRLVLLDEHSMQKGLTSWFVSRAIRSLKVYRPQTKAILSFADSAEGHNGTIYQALNFFYCGLTGRAVFYRDAEGRLRHRRQNGVNITPSVASEMGWSPEKREAKHRYLFISARGGERKQLLSLLRLTILSYPKTSGFEQQPSSVVDSPA